MSERATAASERKALKKEKKEDVLCACLSVVSPIR